MFFCVCNPGNINQASVGLFILRMALICFANELFIYPFEYYYFLKLFLFILSTYAFTYYKEIIFMPSP